MTDEHDARRAPGPHARAPESEPAREPTSEPALPIGMAAASASASLSIIDIPAIVRRRARPHARARDPESSGLVDITELCFGEGLSRAPITPLLPITADPEPARRVDHERRLLWAMTAAAAVAVAAMFAVAVAQAPAPVIIRAEPEPAPTMAAIDRASAARPSGDVEVPAAIRGDDDEHDTPIPQQDDAAVVIDDTPAEPTPEPAARSPRSSRSPASSRSRSTPPTVAGPSATTPAAAPPRAPNTDAKTEMPVECVLDPKSCGLGGATPKGPSSPPAAAPKSLPEKLGTTALRAVLGPAKSTAQTCGPRHGAARGTQVQVKLSIEGSTGRVQSATPLGEHAGTALGRCVADALEAAVFPPFQAAQQGVVWPIRL